MYLLQRKLHYGKCHNRYIESTQKATQLIEALEYLTYPFLGPYGLTTDLIEVRCQSIIIWRKQCLKEKGKCIRKKLF